MYSKSLGVLFSSVAVCLAIPSDADAQPWRRNRHLLPAPRPGTVEALIAPLFANHASECSLSFPSSRSPVPRRIRKALGETEMSAPGERILIAGRSALWYVYHDNEIQQPAVENPPAGRLLDPTFESGQALVESDLRFGGTALARSCTGALEATVEVNSPPYPPASARAALQANLQKKSTLTAIGGRFISPMAAVLEQNDWRTRHARLQLWNLYRREPTLIGHAHYMREFRGVMLQRLANMSEDHDFNLGADANLGMVNAHLRARLTGNNTLDVRELATVIFSDVGKPERVRRYEPLPEPSEIATLAFGSNAATPLNLTDPMRQNADHAYRFKVDGVPSSVCSRPWQVESQSQDWYAAGTTPTVTTTTLSAAANNQIPGCEFSFVWRPRDQDVGQAAGQARVRASIRSVDAIGDARLVIPVDQTFYASDMPRLTQRNPGYMAASTTPTGEGTFSQHWDIELQVQDQGDPIRRTPGTQLVLGQDAKLICSGSREVPVSARAEANAQGVFSLYLETAANLREEDYLSATDNCDFTVTTHIPMADSARRVPRSLVARVAMRRPKPQPAPSPAPGTQEE